MSTMFAQKRGSVDINKDQPTFLVKYAGKTETFQASGKGCTHNAVQRIWDNSVEERYMRRMSIYVNAAGMVVQDLEGNKKDPHKIDIKDISYCCAEKGSHDRIFAWIAKDKAQHKLFCYAVVCTNADKARMMAIILSHSFQVAYRDWKMKLDKEARLKSSKQLTNTSSNTETTDSPKTIYKTKSTGTDRTTNKTQATGTEPTSNKTKASATESTVIRAQATATDRTASRTQATSMDHVPGVIQAIDGEYATINKQTASIEHTTNPKAGGSEHTANRTQATGSEYATHKTQAAGSEYATHTTQAAGSEHATHRTQAAGSDHAAYQTQSTSMHTTNKSQSVGSGSEYATNSNQAAGSDYGTHSTQAAGSEYTTHGTQGVEHTATNSMFQGSLYTISGSEGSEHREAGEDGDHREGGEDGDVESVHSEARDTEILGGEVPAFDYTDQSSYTLGHVGHTVKFADQGSLYGGESEVSASHSVRSNGGGSHVSGSVRSVRGESHVSHSLRRTGGQSHVSGSVRSNGEVSRTGSNSSWISDSSSVVNSPGIIDWAGGLTGGGINGRRDVHGDGSDSEDSVAFTNAMSQMNFVEENEICFADSAIKVE